MLLEMTAGTDLELSWLLCGSNLPKYLEPFLDHNFGQCLVLVPDLIWVLDHSFKCSMGYFCGSNLFLKQKKINFAMRAAGLETFNKFLQLFEGCLGFSSWTFVR